MLNFLQQAFEPIKRGLWISLVFGLFTNLLMLATPLYMLQIYDRVLTSRSVDTLLLLTLIVVSALIVYGLLEFFRSQMMRRMGDWVSESLSQYALSQSISLNQQAAKKPGVQPLRDLEILRGFLPSPALTSVIDTPWSIIFLIFIFLLHPLLGWVALIGALVLLALSLLNDKLTKKIQLATGMDNLSAMQQADLAIRNAELIEAMGLAKKLVGKWHTSNQHFIKKQKTSGEISGSFAATAKVLRLCIQVFIMGLGAWLAIDNQISAGGIIAASILVSRALAPVDQAISSWRVCGQAREAYDRLDEHFAGFQWGDNSMPLPEPIGTLSVEELKFSYSNDENYCVDHVSFALAAGETLVIMGASGSGKTTLARLLLGVLHPTSGYARLDGMDMSKWSATDRGQYVGYLPQDIELFSGTVGENIARLEQGESSSVIAAAKMADVHELIMRMPEGYDTPIGQNGMSLSGGQRQRIGLARALYGNPRFVVLDEPNAHLDKAGEDALIRVLESLKKQEITTVIISHKTNILKQADRILILEAGKVKALGTEKELVEAAQKQGEQKRKGMQKVVPANISYKVNLS